MPTTKHEATELGPPPRHARLHARCQVRRCALALAMVLPGGCVYVLQRADDSLERLAREGVVIGATVSDKEHRPRGFGKRSRESHRLEATYVVDGRSYVTSEGVNPVQFDGAVIGEPVQVTYLPRDPTIARLGIVDAARVRDERAAAVGVGVGAAVVFGAMLWFLERSTRRALRLARHGRTGTATIVAVRAARAGRTRRDVAEYEFRADDGERAGSSTFRTAVPPELGPGATATVLFDPEQPDRSELVARLREIVRFPPAMRADRT